MNTESSRLKLVPFAVAVLLGGIHGLAWSSPVTTGAITLDGTYALSGGPTQDGTASNPPFTNGNGADFYLYNGAGGDSVLLHSYGFTGAYSYFGARASGTGNFAGSTSANFHMTFTNTSSVAQMFSFAFNLEYGQLGITGAGAGFADLMLRVQKDGADVSRDHTTISQMAVGGVTCTTDDLGSLSGYLGCDTSASASASGGGGPFSVNLGLIGAGESFTLDYDIIATVSGNLANGTGTRTVCEGGYGATLASSAGSYGGTICHEESYDIAGGAIARSGDPFGTPIYFVNTLPYFSVPGDARLVGTFSGVPEPASWALMGGALAGLAATRRKKSGPGSGA